MEDVGILGEFRNLGLCYQGELSTVKAEGEIAGDDDDNEEENKLKRKLKEMYEKI